MKLKITPRQENVEIIKDLIFKNVSRYNDTISKRIERIVSLENHYYELTEDKEYLLMAIDHITAYLELGYNYAEFSELFNDTLAKLDTNKDEVFDRPFYCAERIRVNKTQIGIMLGRWCHQKNAMKKNEVVADIISHILNKDIGTYAYKNSSGEFKLIINPDEAYGCRISPYGVRYYTFLIKQFSVKYSRKAKRV